LLPHFGKCPSNERIKTMTNEFATRIVLAARPKGKPVDTDFRIEKFPIPRLGPKELLLQIRYLSLDPYMRGRMDDKKSYIPPLQIGDVMTGEGIAEVILSNDPEFSIGDLVLAYSGWQTHFLAYGKDLRRIDSNSVPVTTRLGVLGMPGFTAYSGLYLIGKPKAGETVVVAAASGPVGSLVGQLAKAAGARSVGIAGGQEKCTFVKDILGFDEAIDHKSPNFERELAVACPSGVDVYFENVGGLIWQAVLPLLNKFARVPVCGLISQYNGVPAEDLKNSVAATMRQVLFKSLTIQGFIVYDFLDSYPEFLTQVGNAVQSGKIKYREDIVEGIENAPRAFMGMLEGRNFGKLIVKVS
jgi:NADPH-dependent curcumin reductase CurA